MNFARRQLNAVLLPDGKVLVTGGTSGAGFNNKDYPVFAAELWDPASESWSLMDRASIPRLYHSATVLLPDGRVLSIGGNGYPDTEIYSPPYLFQGVRPTIDSAPEIAAYGESFFVETSDAAAIAKVRMIRLSSTTHSVNMGQHPVEPEFSQTAGGLTVTPPVNRNLAPPGHYLLFVVDSRGIPSIGRMVRLASTSQPPPPAPTPQPPPGGTSQPPPPPGCDSFAATAGCRVNGASNQTCRGTEGNDVIDGTQSADVILGGGGDDLIYGRTGDDVICGGAGDDRLRGGLGNDRLYGESGDDHLKGGTGQDALDGGADFDNCRGGLGSDSAVDCETVLGLP
jgi:hypothetical protein